MVRAGKASHPSQWAASGYNEIQHPPERYALIDRHILMELCDIKSSEQLSLLHRQWIGESLAVSLNAKEPAWSESVAVGSRHFLEDIKKMLRDNNNRDIFTSGEICTLREPISPYNSLFSGKKGILSPQNGYYFDI